MRPLTLALLLVASAFLAGCSSSGPSSPGAGEPLGEADDSTFRQRYHLNATLAPPVTHYNVVRTGFNPLVPGSDSVLGNETYTWTWTNSNACGRFDATGSRAVWHHGDDTDCDHASPSHPGKVTVVIGDLPNSTASTGYGTCEYEGGSNTGRGAECFVSSVAPEGKAPARDTSIPGAAPVAVLLGAALPALLLRRRRA